jgi:hypothetical protein
MAKCQIEKPQTNANTAYGWVLSGAGPQHRNFEHFVMERGGMRILFDPYQVGCYAEGRYEVLARLDVLASKLDRTVEPLIG